MEPKFANSPIGGDFNDIYTNIFNLINDFIFILDTKGNIMKVNNAVEERMGYSMDELLNKSVLEIHPPEKLDEAAAIVENILKGGTDSCNIPLITKDGKLIPVETKITRGKIKSKDIIVGISRDITEHKKSEDALIREKSFTENALNAQRDTFFVFNPSTGKPIRWNKAFKDISGYSDEEILQLEAPVSYYNEEDLKKLAGSIKLIEGGKTTINEANLITKDGNLVPFEYVASGIFDDDRNLKYIVAIGRNIIERKETEQKLQESEEKFRTISDQSLFGIGIVQDNAIKYANEKLAGIFGYTKEEIMKWAPGEYIKTVYPEDKEFSLEQSQKKQEGASDYVDHYQFRGVKKTGEIIWIDNFTKSIIYGGKPADLVTFIDITEKMEAEQKLEDIARFPSENPNPILRANSNEILYTNNSGIKLFHIQEGSKVPEVLKEYIRESLSSEIIQDIELILDDRYYSFAITPIKETGYVNIYGRDISERKIAEQKLKESEENFRSIFEAIPDLYFLISRDTTILDYKGSIKDLYISPELLIGQKISDIMPTEVADLNQTATKKSLETKEPQIVEYELIIEKEKRSFEARHLYLSEDRVSVFIRDITKRKRAEELLKESEENYKNAFNRANFYKDLFAHDMNNVLNSILLSIELITETPKIQEKMKKIDELFNIIKESSNRGAQLVSNVQKLSSLEDSGVTVQKIDVSTFLHDAISFIKNNFPNKDIEIIVEASLEDVHVMGNELLLDVFENIMINSVKYNKNEKKEIVIKTSEIEADGQKLLKFEFIDNGIGIEQYRKEKIFEVGNREYKGGRGMGLGLSLVKKIVESYGGKIMVEDKVPGDYSKGSNFILLIPKSD